MSGVFQKNEGEEKIPLLQTYTHNYVIVTINEQVFCCCCCNLLCNVAIVLGVVVCGSASPIERTDISIRNYLSTLAH